MFKYLNGHHLGAGIEFTIDITEVVHSVFNVLHCPCIILFVRIQLNLLITVLN
jgi:hypothetical protein